RRCTLRLTPATLPGVRGRPITAEAVSTDNDTLPSGEKRSDMGVAHKMQAKSAVAPTVAIFDIGTSKVRHPEPMEIKLGLQSSKSRWTEVQPYCPTICIGMADR